MPAASRVSDLEVDEIYQEQTTVAGTDLTVDATAITVTITGELNGQEITDTDTFHEIYVDGTWRFTVIEAEAMADGRCS